MPKKIQSFIMGYRISAAFRAGVLAVTNESGQDGNSRPAGDTGYCLLDRKCKAERKAKTPRKSVACTKGIPSVFTEIPMDISRCAVTYWPEKCSQSHCMTTKHTFEQSKLGD